MPKLFDKITLYLIVLTFFLLAIPYGTVDPWWESLFVCWIFFLASIRFIFALITGNEFKFSRLSIPLLALAAFAYFQSLPIFRGGEAISADPAATWFFSLLLLALVLLFELLRNIISDFKNFQVLLGSLVGLCVLIALFGIARELFLGGITEALLEGLKPGRGFALFVNRNHAAMAFNMALGLSAGFIFNRFYRDKRMFFVSLAAILLVGLVLSLSRGGIFAFIGQVIVSLIIFLPKNQEAADTSLKKIGKRRFRIGKIATNLVVAVVITAVLVGGILWIGGERLSDRVSRISEDAGIAALETKKNADMSRLDFWRYTWALFRANPSAGAGFGSYHIAINRYFENSGRMELHQAHNDYAEFLASGGVIGLILGIWFLAALFRVIKDNRKILDKMQLPHFYGALIALAGVATHSVVDFGLHITFNAALFFMVLAVIAVSPRVKKPQERSLNATELLVV